MEKQAERNFAIINVLSLCFGRLPQRELHEKGMYDMWNNQTQSYKNLKEIQSMGEKLGN
jgi:hypothetical protein